MSSTATPTVDIDPQTVVRKVTRNVIPFVFVLYIVNYIDRANIGRRPLLHRLLPLRGAEQHRPRQV